MKEYLDKSLTFDEYVGLIDKLRAEGKTTGPNQSDAMLHYAKLNRQRLRRLETTIRLSADVKEAAKNLSRKMIWLIITEGWCGDAAQSIPAIEKIAAESGNIETRYLLRDENPELIDRFLTEGARSIPKLIALDAASLEVLGSWGARPAAAQQLFYEMRAQGFPKPFIMESLQRWYNEDKSQSVQAELLEIIERWQETGTQKSAV